MELSEDAYIEFKRLYEKNYGGTISTKKAKIMADQFLSFMGAIHTHFERGTTNAKSSN